MKIYIASKWERRFDLRKQYKKLENLGHELTSSWINKPNKHYSTDDHIANAWEDFEGVKNCDVLILDCGRNIAGKGMFVEFGMAIALGKTIVIIGKTSCIFQFLGFSQFDTWTKFLKSKIINNVMA